MVICGVCVGRTFVTPPIVKEAVGLLVLSSLPQECGQSSGWQHHAGGKERLQPLHHLGSRVGARLPGWGARWPGLHQHRRESVCPWLPMLQWRELELQDFQSFNVVARFKVFKVFLLQQQKPHFSLTRRVLEVRSELLQDVHSSGPVSLHDTVPEGGGGGLVEPAPGLLHEDIGAGPQTNVTQVLPDKPDYLLIKLVQFCLPLDSSEELRVHPRVGRAEFSLRFTENVCCCLYCVHSRGKSVKCN